jgi:hypothetical protein
MGTVEYIQWLTRFTNPNLVVPLAGFVLTGTREDLNSTVPGFPEKTLYDLAPPAHWHTIAPMSNNRVIVTKHRIYELPSDAQGVPVEEYFAGVTLPEPLKGSGAKVYETADGPVLAMPRRRKQRSAEPVI